MKRTSRGFGIYTEFVDTYGQEVRVQQSSSAESDRVWIFCNKEGKSGFEKLGEIHSYSPHLSRKQAVRLAQALLRFATPTTTLTRQSEKEK